MKRATLAEGALLLGLTAGCGGPSLQASVIDCSALSYAAGADVTLDRPAHVRAASEVVWRGDELVVVQDDALWLATLQPGQARVEALALPAPDGVRLFDNGRSNKMQKPDFEAAFVHDNTLYVFGSGSAPGRYRVAVVEPNSATLVTLSRFYQSLRLNAEFAGSELNVEAVVPNGGWVYLFQRGNGAPRKGIGPVDAVGRVQLTALVEHIRRPESEPPQLQHVVTFDLGTSSGARLTFTGATALEESLMFTASAEASPDTIRDGEVTGSALGLIVEDEARLAPLTTSSGELMRAKAEGVALHRNDNTLAYVVLDRDDPERPAELCRVRLRGFDPP